MNSNIFNPLGFYSPSACGGVVYFVISCCNFFKGLVDYIFMDIP